MNMSVRRRRRALTLLEVIISMAIFMMSMVAIWQLVAIGSQRAIEVKLQSRTSMCCQAKLDEIMVTTPLTSTGYQSFSDAYDANKDLQWKVETNQTTAGLYTVTVSVKADLPSGDSLESKLSRIVLDPSTRGSTQDLPIYIAPAPPTTSSSSTASGSSSGSAGGGTGGKASGKTGATKGGGGTQGGNKAGGAGTGTGGTGTGGTGATGGGTGTGGAGTGRGGATGGTGTGTGGTGTGGTGRGGATGGTGTGTGGTGAPTGGGAGAPTGGVTTGGTKGG
jgi:Tfp pilus assembly protein PilV